MSGHNKWSQIKRQKGAEDAKKSKRFSILARTITMEAKRANGDRNASGLNGGRKILLPSLSTIYKN